MAYLNKSINLITNQTVIHSSCFFTNLLQGFANFINRCRMKEPPFSHNSPERFKARLDPGRRYPRPSGPVHRRFADPLTSLSASRRQPLNPHRKPPPQSPFFPLSPFGIFGVNNLCFNPRAFRTAGDSMERPYYPAFPFLSRESAIS